MRTLLAPTVAALLMPAAALAQSLAQIGLPLPAIGLPLASIGLPVPASTLPASDVLRITPQGPVRQRPGGMYDEGTSDHGRGRHRHSSLWPVFHVILVPVAVPGGRASPAPAFTPSPELPLEAARPGRLRLFVHPDVTVQVRVDGFHVGTLGDADGELTLDAGRHIVELTAEGYAPLVLPVDVPPGRTISYEGALVRAAEAAVRPVAAPDPVVATDVPSSSTIYMIPGCYVGNVAPRQATLPAGCDAGRAVSFGPSR